MCVRASGRPLAKVGSCGPVSPVGLTGIRLAPVLLAVGTQTWIRDDGLPDVQATGTKKFVLLLGGFQMGGQGLRRYGMDLVIDSHPTSALGLRLHLGEAGGELGAAVYRLDATVLQRGLGVGQRRVGPRWVLGG